MRILVVLLGLLVGVIGLAMACAFTAATAGWPVLIVFTVGMAVLSVAMYFGIRWAAS